MSIKKIWEKFYLIYFSFEEFINKNSNNIIILYFPTKRVNQIP